MNEVINSQVKFIDLGRMEYQPAWDFQTEKYESIIRQKLENREKNPRATENYLIMVEHPHVFTLGKSGDEKNLVIPKEELSSIHATYHQINRGGDITYHGPGQLVVYPVLDLENFFTDIHRYMRSLEEVVILTLKEFGLSAGRYEGLTGVWFDPGVPAKERKICALGVKTSRWVTLHGLALNVNTDLNYFNFIVPCGITGKAVTSMEKEVGKPLDMEEVKLVLREKFAEVFKAKLI